MKYAPSLIAARSACVSLFLRLHKERGGREAKLEQEKGKGKGTGKEQEMDAEGEQDGERKNMRDGIRERRCEQSGERETKGIDGVEGGKGGGNRIATRNKMCPRNRAMSG